MMKHLDQPLRFPPDFLNYYTRISARVGRGSLSNVQSGGFNAPPGIELNQMGWQNFGRPIYVTDRLIAPFPTSPFSKGGPRGIRELGADHLPDC